MYRLTPYLLAGSLALTAVTLSAQGQDPFKAQPRDPAPTSSPHSQDPFDAGDEKGGKASPAKQADRAPAGEAAPKRNRSTNRRGNTDEVNDRIRAALDERTSQTFVETPLQDAVRQLSDTHQIPILIDRRALQEIGLDADLPVNLDLKNVTLRSFLRLMLRELDLTYMVKNEVLQITTLEAAEQNLIIEMYPLPDRLAGKSDQIVKALTATVTPDTWETQGGPSSVNVIDNVLVVSTTESVHGDVEDFMRKFEQAYKKRNAKQ